MLGKGFVGVILIVVALALSTAAEAQEEAIMCYVPESLPLSYAGPHFEIKHGGLIARGHTTGILALRNNSPKTVQGLNILVEYYDERGALLVAIPYAAQRGRQVGPFLLGKHSLVQDVMWDSVEPGGLSHLNGISPFLIAKCPASAKVTLVEAIFSDHSSTMWTERDWHIAPVLASTPETWTLLPAFSAISEPFVLKVSLDAEGAVADVTPRVTSHGNHVRALMDYVKAWRFAPALANGKQIPSEVVLWVRFIDQKSVEPFGPSVTDDLQFPVVTVLVGPAPYLGDWSLSYGFFGIPRSIRSEP